MLRILKTFNGHNINDGNNYKAALLNPNGLPQAQNVYLPQTNADSAEAGVYTVDVGTLAITIKVLDYANRYTLIGQLQRWFKRGTAANLVVTYLDDGLDYYKPCRVVNLVQDPEHPMYFVATLNTGWTTWRAVTADTYSWGLSGTGGTHVLSLAGDDETPLSINFTVGSGPANGYLYQQLYELINLADVPALGRGPWCMTVDTASLVADTANNCLLNGAIVAGDTTITYDTETGTLPSIGVGYLDSEQITWTGKTATQLTGVTRGVGGTAAAAHADNTQLDLSYVLANGDDLRIFLNGVETRRWISNMNNASTKIWFNLTLSAGYNLSLLTAITDTLDFTYIYFEKTADTYAAIQGLPTEGILVHGTEWMKYRKVDSGLTVSRLEVVQRGVLGTARQTHASGDVFQFMENVIQMCYGNSAAVAPDTLDATYNDTKPLFSLSSSSNTSWMYTSSDLFIDDIPLVAGDTGHPDRTGGWKPAILARKGKDSGYYRRDGDTYTVPAMGMLITSYYLNGSYPTADVAEIVWNFYRACGISSVTMAGEKYVVGSIWPAVAGLWYSIDGQSFDQVWNESIPASASTWTALGTHSGDSTSNARWLRLRLAGACDSASSDEAAFEVQTATLNFVSANLPTGSLLGQTLNAYLDLTFSNTTNGDSFDMIIPMLPGLTLAMDADAKTVLYDNVNAHEVITLDNEARDWWIGLEAGSNTLSVSANDVGSLTVDLSWLKRRF